MGDIKSSRGRNSTRPSGRFVLRIDPGLHALLSDAARRADVSLNDYCIRKLTQPGDPAPPSTEIVGRAAELFGARLDGVVAFGSWARDELAGSSDLDVLVVVAPDTAITRDLYRRWDAAPVSWDGHPVEAHFVHLPPRDARVSGLWAEAAIDGAVLFDRDLAVSRRLAHIRHRIVAGELVRHWAHGQPYWVEAA